MIARIRRGRLQDWVGWILLGVITVVVVAAFVRGDGRGTSTPADKGSEESPREIPTAPLGAPRKGMYVQSTVMTTGDVEVEHWITAATPIGSLALSAADPDGLPGGVVARKVVVIGDGIVLSRRAEIGTKPQTLELRRPVQRLYVSYRITGGLGDRSTVAGRVLARSVALDVDYEGEAGPVSRFVTGPGTVLNVACMLRDDRDRTPRPCGRATDDGWLVEQQGRFRDDRLLVQLELA